jgi:hypothetical protein
VESGKPLSVEAGPKLSESPIAREHPELFHYTGIAGLEGIVRTQTLWATHAAFLNDALEIRAFAARLPSVLRASVEDGMSALIRDHPANQSIVDEAGGLTKAAEQTATAVTEGMYRALLGAPDSAPFAEPYITSFCTASSELVAKHGLLSQWRGYGREGGYALVFATARLDLLLKAEAERWRHALFGGDVIYSSASDEEMRKELGSSIDEIAACINQWLVSAGKDDALEPVYDHLVMCACRYKHWGFHEEKEVRVIAIPPNRELFAEQKARGLVLDEKPRHHFLRGGAPVPCIHLFEGVTTLSHQPLPITRIIVGPLRDQNRRCQAVEALLTEYQLHIPVTASEIPFTDSS